MSTNSASSTDAAAALDNYVRAQAGIVLEREPALREGPEAVHATRVAVRRLRSTFRVFAKAIDLSVDGPRFVGLEGELCWYAGMLGAVRDCQVQRIRLAQAVSSLPGELVLGSVSQDIDDELSAELRRQHDRLVSALDGERYALLRLVVGRLAAEPSYQRPPTRDFLLDRARRARRTADRRLRGALESGDAELLHQARKTAKRARYAAELIEPFRPRVVKHIDRFKAIQDALGAHQDSVLSSRLLLQLGGPLGSRAGHNGFTFGLLYAEQLRAAENARRLASTL